MSELSLTTSAAQRLEPNAPNCLRRPFGSLFPTKNWQKGVQHDILNLFLLKQNGQGQQKDEYIR